LGQVICAGCDAVQEKDQVETENDGESQKTHKIQDQIRRIERTPDLLQDGCIHGAWKGSGDTKLRKDEGKRVRKVTEFLNVGS